MKGKAKSDLHTKTIAEFETLLKEKQAALVKTKMEKALNKIKNVHAVKLIRREIAIIQTMKREKEIEHG